MSTDVTASTLSTMAVIPSPLYFSCAILMSGEACPTGAAVTFGIGTVAEQSIIDVGGGVVDDLDDAGFYDLLVGDVSVDTLLIKQGPNDTGAFQEIHIGHSGEASGSGGNPSTSLLVRKNTGIGGRANQGRMYIPGVAEDAVEDDGTLESGFETSAQDVLNDLTANLLSTEGPHAFSMPMVILHGAGTAQPPQVLNLALQHRIANQRRRNRR